MFRRQPSNGHISGQIRHHVFQEGPRWELEDRHCTGESKRQEGGFRVEGSGQASQHVPQHSTPQDSTGEGTRKRAIREQ
eukprot:1613879-Alexandrium_andersonii.AAC.1